MRNGVCVASENDNHPYVALRILRDFHPGNGGVSIVVAPDFCDVNVGALTGLLSTPIMPCILYFITTHNALHHASLPIMPCILYCIITHNALHHYPQGWSIGFFLQDVGVPSPHSWLACTLGAHREGVAVTMLLSSCCFSGSLGSSSVSFLSWLPRQMAKCADR